MKEYSKEEWIEEFETLFAQVVEMSPEYGRGVAEQAYAECFPGSTPKEAAYDELIYWFTE